jgi:sensor domain CHASE-containing protein
VERPYRRWLDRLLALTARSHKVSVALPVGIVLVGTFFVFTHLRRVEQAKLVADFDAQTTSIYNGMRSNFNVYLETVESISSFYAASQGIERRSFREFVARTLSQYDGIQALGWDPRVTQSERLTSSPPETMA